MDKDWVSGYITADEEYKQRRGYTHEEIKQLLDACSEDRIRVAILLMCSAGLRVGAIVYTSKEEYSSTLEFGDLEERPEYGGRYKVWVYNRSKTEGDWTICSCECTTMIKKYRDYRRDSGEIIKENSPLIREQFDADNKWAVTHPRKISLVDLNTILKLVINKSGISKQTKGKVKQTHGCRVFYNTTLANAGIPDSHRRLLSGHAPVANDGSYIKPDPEALFADYLKVEDLLTIDPLQRIQKENQELKSTMAEEIAKLKSQLRESREFANKTAAEINHLKAGMDIHGWEYTMACVAPNLSNIIDALNETRAKDGLAPVAIITPEDKEAKLRSMKYQSKQIKEGTEFDVPFPEDEGSRARRIKELELEIKEIEENPNLIIDRLK